MNELSHTPLHAAQRMAGARMMEFSGWELPVQFAGVLQEHRSVRVAAGVFDVSHMGRFAISGPGAAESLQRLLTNDLRRLSDGRAQYTLLCREDGGVLDDLVVYRHSETQFLVVVNAGNRLRDFEWMRSRLQVGAELVDQTFDQAMLAVQGPKAAEWLIKMGARELESLPRWGVVQTQVLKVPCWAARTGYTGEDGFELFCASSQVETLWLALVDAGITPCGLGARDTLRLEAALPLYGHELTEQVNPFEAGLGWTVSLEKGNFVGREALSRTKVSGPARKLVGFEMQERGIARAGYEVRAEAAKIGLVTSGGPAPSIQKNIGLALLPLPWSLLESTINIMIRDKPTPASVVKTPFYRARTHA